jgi:hypothetical protein
MSATSVEVYLLGREVKGVMEYWTGEVTEHGMPRVSPWKSDGYHFHGARAAYEAADTHKALRLSDQWRAVRRSTLPSTRAMTL